MKRSICLFLLVTVISVSLFSCRRGTVTPVRDDLSADALMETVVGSISATASAADGYVSVSEGYINASMWGEDYERLSEALSDYAICISGHSDMNIDELGIFLVKDDYDPVEIADIARDYLQSQCLRYRSLLEAYNPAELPKTAGGEVLICGRYVLYTLLDSTATSQAQVSFKHALTGGVA